MSKRVVAFLAGMHCAMLVIASVAIAQEKDGRQGDSRQITVMFLDAALNGRLREAAALGEAGKAYSREEKIKEFAALQVKSVKLSDVRANGEHALAITEDVKSDDGREGPLVLTLVKTDGLWWIRDVDLETTDSARVELDRFMKANPDAKAVPDQETGK
jgi:hypothetical protein